MRVVIVMDHASMATSATFISSLECTFLGVQSRYKRVLLVHFQMGQSFLYLGFEFKYLICRFDGLTFYVADRFQVFTVLLMGMMSTLKHQRRLLFKLDFVNRCKILLRLWIISGQHADLVFDTLEYFVKACWQVYFFVFLLCYFAGLELLVLGRRGDCQNFLLVVFLILQPEFINFLISLLMVDLRKRLQRIFGHISSDDVRRRWRSKVFRLMWLPHRSKRRHSLFILTHRQPVAQMTRSRQIVIMVGLEQSFTLGLLLKFHIFCFKLK